MRKILIFILCFTTIVLCFAIPSFADDSLTPRAYPTDLTGYTVTIPAGWSAPAEYGNFEVDGTQIFDGGTYDFIQFRVGYDGDEYSPNFIYLLKNVTGLGKVIYQTAQPLTFKVTGGVDADFPDFIAWLVINDAIFVAPEPETSSISAGTYHFKTFGNLPDIPDAGWSDGSGYTYSYSVAGKLATNSRIIAFTALNLTFNDYIGSSRYSITFSVDTADGIVNLATYSASYGQIETDIRPDLRYLVFDEDLIGTYDDIEFIREFLVSGMPDVDTSATDNPWAYILEKIIQALQVDLFGYFSIWDIFTTICGIFIVTWLLKLLAGG